MEEDDEYADEGGDISGSDIAGLDTANVTKEAIRKGRITVDS